MSEPLTLATFRADLAEVLHQQPDEVDFDENPLYAGLDSLRIVTLAERTSFDQWWDLIAERQAGVEHAEA